MKGLSGFAYPQARLQSRYGLRADAGVWLRLHNIDDLGSYLQVAQQTALRHWVLGIGPAHSSHDIELALRQKYRQQVDEVTAWLPAAWRPSVQWIKRLVDLPVLQYLVAGEKPLPWMKTDPDISAFTVDDPVMRSVLVRDAGCASLVDARLQGESMRVGWLSQWSSIRPQVKAFEQGLVSIEKLLQQQMQLQANPTEAVLPADSEAMSDRLRVIFRRYAFQPAAVYAYLAIVAIDLHRIRRGLLRRLLFVHTPALAEDQSV